MSRKHASEPAGPWENAALGGFAAAAYAGFLALAYVNGAPGPDASAPSAAAAAPNASLSSTATEAGLAVPRAASAASSAVRPSAAATEELVRPEGVDLVDPRAGPPDALNPHLEFLVKIKGEEVSAIRDAFLQDPDAARGRFKTLAGQRAAFKDLKLKRVAYNGEMTLEWAGAPPTTAEEADAISKTVVDRLKSAPGLVYAEPNLVGWKEKHQP